MHGVCFGLGRTLIRATYGREGRSQAPQETQTARDNVDSNRRSKKGRKRKEEEQKEGESIEPVLQEPTLLYERTDATTTMMMMCHELN